MKVAYSLNCGNLLNQHASQRSCHFKRSISRSLAYNSVIFCGISHAVPLHVHLHVSIMICSNWVARLRPKHQASSSDKLSINSKY